MKSSIHRFHVALSDRHWQALHFVATTTQLTISEVVRSMVEQGLSTPRLNDMYPSLSGTLKVGE